MSVADLLRYYLSAELVVYYAEHANDATRRFRAATYASYCRPYIVAAAICLSPLRDVIVTLVYVAMPSVYAAITCRYVIIFAAPSCCFAMLFAIRVTARCCYDERAPPY